MAPWQLLTYAFLHGGLVHLAFNMFALYMFGGAIEQVFGARRYLIYYLVCVLSAALSQLAVAALMGGIYPTIGASGGVFGLLLAYGMYFPNNRVMLLFPPIPMPARVFVLRLRRDRAVSGCHGQPGGRGALRAPGRHDRWLHHASLLARLGRDATAQYAPLERAPDLFRGGRRWRGYRAGIRRALLLADFFPTALVRCIARVDAIEVLLFLREERILRGELGLELSQARPLRPAATPWRRAPLLCFCSSAMRLASDAM